MQLAEYCPVCASPQIDRVRMAGETLYPGDVTDYICVECWHVFAAIIPEPPEEYRGDGTFAENH